MNTTIGTAAGAGTRVQRRGAARRAPGALLATMALLVLGAWPVAATCAPSTGPLPDGAGDSSTAVVVLQIRSRTDGKLDRAKRSAQLPVYLARIDSQQSPAVLGPHTGCAASAAEGWLCLKLTPGTYYLLALPPGLDQNPPAVVFHAPSARYGRLIRYRLQPGRGGSWSAGAGLFVLAGARPDDFRELSGFWFVVPPRTPLVWLGSIEVSCTTGKGLFGNLIDSCSDFSVSSADDEAARVAAAADPAGGPVRPSRLVPNGMPAPEASARLRGPLALTVAAPGALGPAAFGGAAPSVVPLIHGATAEIGLFNLLALATGELSRSAARADAKRGAQQLQPCVDALSTQLQVVDTAALFSAAIAAGLRAGGLQVEQTHSDRPVVEAAPALTLTATTQRIALRQCGGPDSFCLELETRLRLLASASGEVLYDSTLLYSGDLPPVEPSQAGARLYQRLLEKRSVAAQRSDWCGDAGMGLVQERIRDGAGEMAAQLLRDLAPP